MPPSLSRVSLLLPSERIVCRNENRFGRKGGREKIGNFGGETADRNGMEWQTRLFILTVNAMEELRKSCSCRATLVHVIKGGGCSVMNSPEHWRHTYKLQ